MGLAGEEAGGCEWGWLGKRLVGVSGVGGCEWGWLGKRLGKRLVGVSGVGLVVSVCMQ